MLSAVPRARRRHRLRRGGLLRRTRGEAPALDRRHGGGRGIRVWSFLALALPFIGGVWAPPMSRGVRSPGVVRRGRDRAALRVPRDRADEHPLAPHRRGLGHRADAVGAARRTARRCRPIGYRRAGRRARRRRAGRASSPARRWCGPSARGLVMAVGAGLAIGAFLIVDRPDERRERTRAARHDRATNTAITRDHRRRARHAVR